MSSPEEFSRLPIQAIQAQANLAFSPDGRYIATAESGIRLWNVSTGDLISELSSTTGARKLVFSGDSRRIATWSGRVFRVAEIASGDDTVVGMLAQGHELLGLDQVGDHLITADLARGRVHVWRAQSLHRHAGLTYDGKASWVAFSADGDYLWTVGLHARGSSEHIQRVWHLETGRLLLEWQIGDPNDWEIDEEDSEVPGEDLRRYEKNLTARLKARNQATVEPDARGKAERFRRVGEEITTFEGGRLAMLSGGPDGTRFVDLEREQEFALLVVKPQHGSRIPKARTRDDRYLAEWDEGIVYVRDAETGQEVYRHSLQARPSQLAFSPDQKHLAIVVERRVQLWRWQLADLREKVCELLKANSRANRPAQEQSQIASSDLTWCSDRCWEDPLGCRSVHLQTEG